MTCSLDDARATSRAEDAWWRILMVDPLACRITKVIAERTILTPGRLTAVSFALGTLAAACFAQATHLWLAAGAVVFCLALLIEAVGTRLAAATGDGGPFGDWLRFFGARSRAVVCALALSAGLYAITGQIAYLALGFAVGTIDLFFFVNDRHCDKVRKVVGAPAPRRAFGVLEFQAAVFVVGPLLGPEALIPVAAVAAALLLAIEVIGVARVWAAARRFERGTGEAVAQPYEPRRTPVTIA